MSLNNIPFVSLDRIFAKLKRDLGQSELAEGDIIEWSAEALEAIGAVTQYKQAIAFIAVTNYQFDLPTGTHRVAQIAKNNCADIDGNCITICPEDVVADCSTVEDAVDAPVCLDCNGRIIGDYDIAYYRPFFDLQWEYDLGRWYGNTRLTSCFTPMRLSTNNFFLANQSHQDFTSPVCEYTYINNTTIRCDFKEGQVAVSYYKQATDTETGYPLIPDHYSYTTAITKYVTYKVMERMFYAGRQGSETRLQKAEQDWHWYCKQAGNLAIIPTGEDEVQNHIEQSLSHFPRINDYYDFFGSLNKKTVGNVRTRPRNQHYRL